MALKQHTQLYIQLIFIFLFVGKIEGLKCPFGFMGHDRSCYWFSHRAVTFWDAITICRHFNSHLAVITSEDEDDYIRDFAARYGKANAYWIGGSDLRREGTWTWEHPVKKLKYLYRNWSPGQPDNASGTEHCLELRRPLKYRWNDQQCYTKNNFICEKNM